MKKKILHYLPVMIAAALLALCLLCVGIYDKAKVPYATVSFSVEIATTVEDELLDQKTILGIDLSVSLGGRVLLVDYPDERSLEFFEPLSLKGRPLDEALKTIQENVPSLMNATAFVGVFASEDKMESEDFD